MDYSPHWLQHSCASGKGFFFFFLKPLAHDKNHLNCLDCFKEDFSFNDVTVFFFPVRELLSSDAMKEYNRARVYLDENYKSQEHFTVSAEKSILHFAVVWLIFMFGICPRLILRFFRKYHD